MYSDITLKFRELVNWYLTSNLAIYPSKKYSSESNFFNLDRFIDGLILKLLFNVTSTEVLNENLSPNSGISSRYAISLPVPKPPLIFKKSYGFVENLT